MRRIFHRLLYEAWEFSGVKTVKPKRKIKVSVAIYNESLVRLKLRMEKGFQEGFKVTMNDLVNI